MMETTALGAAFLAGYRAGVGPTPEGFAATWQLDRRFMPAMDEATRAKKWAGWQTAIARVRTSALRVAANPLLRKRIGLHFAS